MGHAVSVQLYGGVMADNGGTTKRDTTIEVFEPVNRWADANGRDPDGYSATLLRYHQVLWSNRPLTGVAGAQVLRLVRDGTGLVDTALDRSFFDLKERLFLSSDSTIPTWWRWPQTAALRSDPALQARVDAAYWPLYAMGGMIMFPGHQVDGRWTINQAKGCNTSTIGDRLDLTLECIRLHYADVHDKFRNPLGPTLLVYRDFFDLFADFDGYVEFWLLHDLVDGGRVSFFLGGEHGTYDFRARTALPRDADEYVSYLERVEEFVLRRNARMAASWQEQLALSSR